MGQETHVGFDASLGVLATTGPNGNLFQCGPLGDIASLTSPPGQGPIPPGHVYQDSYVSFLSHPAGTALFLF